MIPTLYMAVGLPGSGKSTWAENNKEYYNFFIHSSDAIRGELGDVNDQINNENVFSILHKRIKEDLLVGNNVFMDATNLSRKRRVHFLQNQLKNIPCKKICVLFATDHLECLRKNSERGRIVPDEVINRMFKSFETPWYTEGFDTINIIWDMGKYNNAPYDYLEDLLLYDLIPHDNPHHTLTIGEHMRKAERIFNQKYFDGSSHSKLLQYATILHDMGKGACKTFLDSKGNKTSEAKYYQHHNVGAYYALFYMKYIRENYAIKGEDFSNKAILYVSLLINLHMKYFMDWKESEKAKRRDRSFFGEGIMSDLDKLHECDLAAH